MSGNIDKYARYFLKDILKTVLLSSHSRGIEDIALYVSKEQAINSKLYIKFRARLNNFIIPHLAIETADTIEPFSCRLALL